MKLFEEIELRLSDERNNLKKRADSDKKFAFISEDEIYSYDLALEHYKQAIQAEYDKLCPKPIEFTHQDFYGVRTNWNYISLYSNGCTWYMEKPELTEYLCGWNNVNKSKFYCNFIPINIPFGIDWRLCCWSLEDAKRIHGEDE